MPKEYSVTFELMEIRSRIVDVNACSADGAVRSARKLIERDGYCTFSCNSGEQKLFRISCVSSNQFDGATILASPILIGPSVVREIGVIEGSCLSLLEDGKLSRLEAEHEERVLMKACARAAKSKKMQSL